MRVLFVHNKLQAFVETDLEILKSRHEVREIDFRWKSRKILEILFETFWSDLIFCWFASFHCVLPVLLGKLLGKRIVIVGGDYDIIFDPVVSAGWWRDVLRRTIGLVLFPLMGRYVVNSEFSRKKAMEHVYINPKKVEVIYHGFQNSNAKKCEKNGIVITVSEVEKTKNRRKGLETVVKASKKLPNVRFVLIGEWLDRTIEELRTINSENIIYTGFVSSEELRDWYAKAKVYVQVSYHEGFGCALAEAMVARCIPVVTRGGAIPEVVGETGIYVPYGDIDATADAIQKALENDSDLGEKARERILSRFRLETRRGKLLELVDRVARN